MGPTGQVPIAKKWTRETVFYEGSVVTYDGGSYQALRDTGEPPDNEAHWQCIAAPGRDAKPIRHRGTFEEDGEYMAYDVVALNGGSFLALHDKPGQCPGDARLRIRPGIPGLYLAILNLQPAHNDSAFSRCMPRDELALSPLGHPVLLQSAHGRCDGRRPERGTPRRALSFVRAPAFARA